MIEVFPPAIHRQLSRIALQRQHAVGAGNTASAQGAILWDSLINDNHIMSEVERLLSGRTRDIRLHGRLAQLFRQSSFRQTANVIRSWLMWVMLIDVSMLALNFLLLPFEAAMAMVLAGGLIALTTMGVFLVWRRRHAEPILGAALVGGMAAILFSICMMGMAAGGDYLDRYLHIMLLVAISGVIIFSVPFVQTLAIATLGMALFLAFQLGAQDTDIKAVVSGFIFYTSGVGAMVMARRTMNVIAHKSFLLELRDRHRMAELTRTNQRLERLSMVDGLTGASSRHFVRDRLEALSMRDRKVALLMCDIDHFKGLNDHLGHAEGDRCLIEVARIIMNGTRSQGDCVARYGGEEFLVVLLDADEDAAVLVAERIRKSVADAALENPRSPVEPYVTISIGIAAGSTRNDDCDLDQLQKRADAALYVAKRAGRNRVQLWCPASSEMNKDVRSA